MNTTCIFCSNTLDFSPCSTDYNEKESYCRFIKEHISGASNSDIQFVGEKHIFCPYCGSTNPVLKSAEFTPYIEYICFCNECNEFFNLSFNEDLTCNTSKLDNDDDDCDDEGE